MALEQDSYYGTGKRKDAVARVWLQRGSGNITVNGKDLRTYLHRYSLTTLVLQPLEALEAEEDYDVTAKVKGGGISGQAGALRHGIAKALVDEDEQRRTVLGTMGLLTRDPRVKERKHPGCRGARRGKQFTKR